MPAQAGIQVGRGCNARPQWIPAFETVDFRKFRCVERKLPSPASLAGEDEGEGTSLTDWHANPRRDANFHDDEPSPAPSPAGDAGEGHNSPAVQQTELESRKSTVSYAGMTSRNVGAWVAASLSAQREGDPSIEHGTGEGVMAGGQGGALRLGVGDHVATDADTGEVPGEIGDAIDEWWGAVAKRYPLPVRQRSRHPA